MFVPSSQKNRLESRTSAFSQQSVQRPASSFPEAKAALQKALMATGFCDAQGRVIPSLPHQLPLDDAGRKRLNALWLKKLKVDDQEFFLKDYLDGLQIPKLPVGYGRYLRGSYAAFVIDPLQQLQFALNHFYLQRPEAKAVIEPCFAAYQALRPQTAEPHDADFADLFFAENWTMKVETVQQIRDLIIGSTANLLKKDYGWAMKNGFETLFIPQPNHLTKRAERIVIATLKSLPEAKEIKIDRIVGQLKHYCLFSRDDFYIDILNLPYYPISCQFSFWQSLLDREMNVVRLEERHKKDFSSVLAAIEHYTKGADIDESEVALEQIFDLFLKPLTDEQRENPQLRRMELTHEKLVDVVWKRIENHQVDPLSFLVNFCQKMPEKYADRRESLWRAILSKLPKEKLGVFGFLAESPSSFELFAQDAMSLQGSPSLAPHHFRIERPIQERIGTTHRHFRKLLLLQGSAQALDGIQDIWKAGCNALYSAAKGQVLTVDFVDQLIEDLGDGTVYQEEEVQQALVLCAPFLGKLHVRDWLGDLLKGPYWETALPHFLKTREAYSPMDTLVFVLARLPASAHRALDEMVFSFPPQERGNALFEIYKHGSSVWRPSFTRELLKESEECLCKVAALAYERKDGELLKEIVLQIETAPDLLDWIAFLIAQEKNDQEALALFNRFHHRIGIRDLPKKQRDRLLVELRNLEKPQTALYLKSLVERGEVADAFSSAPQAAFTDEIWRLALEKLQSASLEQFKNCVAYLYSNGQRLESILGMFDEEKKALLIANSSIDKIRQFYERQAIALPLYLEQLRKKFEQEPSLELLWELEAHGETPDPVRVEKLNNQMRSMKQVKVEASLVEKRVAWLQSQKRYREAWLLLDKSAHLKNRNGLRTKLLEPFIAEGACADLTAFFAKESTCAIPPGAVFKKVNGAEDVKGAFALFLKLKGRLPPQENVDLLLNLSERQAKAGIFSDRELQQLLTECFHLPSSHFTEEMQEFLIQEAIRTGLTRLVKTWMREKPPMALRPPFREQWILLHAQEDVPLSEEHCRDALHLITQERFAAWIFKQIAQLDPKALMTLSVEKLPVHALLQSSFDLIVRHFTPDQLWEVCRYIGSDPDRLLKLFRAWHLRGDLDVNRAQQEMIARAPSVQALYPVLRWMKEIYAAPDPAWVDHYPQMDEVNLGLYFELLRGEEFNQTALSVVEHSIRKQMGAFCLSHGVAIVNALMAEGLEGELTSQFQSMYLQRLQMKKQVTMDDVTFMILMSDLAADPALKVQYRQTIISFLLQMSEENTSARDLLLEWMRLNEIQIIPEWKKPLFAFIHRNQVEIFNSINSYDVFLRQVYETFAHSERYVLQALNLWDQWENPYRLKLVLDYLVRHPQSLGKIAEVLTQKVIQEDFTTDEVSEASAEISTSASAQGGRLLQLLSNQLKSRKAMQEGNAFFAVGYFFGMLTVLASMRLTEPFEYDVELHLKELLGPMVQNHQFREVELLFQRFVLYKINDKRLVNFTESLEKEMLAELSTEEGAKELCFAMQEALVLFTKKIHKRRHFRQISLHFEREFDTHLKSVREAAISIPFEWFPYYQSFVSWSVKEWLFIIENSPDRTLKIVIPELIVFLEQVQSHPACNEDTFQHLRLVTREIFRRTVDTSYLLILFKQFISCESMGFGEKKLYESDKMKKEPKFFQGVFKGILDEMNAELRTKGGLMEFHRAFNLMIYAFTAYRPLTHEMGFFCVPLYESFLAKLPSASLEFKSEMVPLAYHLLGIISETKFTKSVRLKLDRLTQK